MAVHDLSVVVVSIDGRSADPSNDGDFINISSKPLYASAAAMGGRSSLDRAMVTDRAATLTCGKGSQWHKLLGQLMATQEQLPAFEGFPFAFLDPQNGDTVTALCVIGEAPEIQRGQAQAAVVWSLILRNVVEVYGTAIL